MTASKHTSHFTVTFLNLSLSGNLTDWSCTILGGLIGSAKRNNLEYFVYDYVVINSAAKCTSNWACKKKHHHWWSLLEIITSRLQTNWVQVNAADVLSEKPALVTIKLKSLFLLFSPFLLHLLHKAQGIQFFRKPWAMRSNISYTDWILSWLCWANFPCPRTFSLKWPLNTFHGNA